MTSHEPAHTHSLVNLLCSYTQGRELLEAIDIRQDITIPLIKEQEYILLFLFFQQAVLSIAHQLVISTLVAEVVCASNDSEFRARLLSSTLFMTGLTTLLMVTVGSR